MSLLNIPRCEVSQMSSTNMDPLYRSVARKVLTETLRMKKGEAVTVEAWNNGLGFARRVVAEARAMGCTAVLMLEDEEAYVEGVRRAPRDSVGAMGKNEYGLLSGTDAYVFVPGQAITAYSKTLTQAELTDSTRYNASWYEAAAKAGLRGARMAFGYVGRDMARMLGRSVEEVVRGQLRAVLVDFGSISRDGGRIAAHLVDGSEASLGSSGAEARFALKGELEVEDGVVDERDVAEGSNMTYLPPGMVIKDLDPDSVNGEVRVSESLTRFGVLRGAELKFQGGRLVGWRSRDSAKLDRVLKTVPEEKRRLVRVGIGLNPAMRYGLGQDRFVRGSITLLGLGFIAVLRNASLTVGGSALVKKGAFP